MQPNPRFSNTFSQKTQPRVLPPRTSRVCLRQVLSHRHLHHRVTRTSAMGDLLWQRTVLTRPLPHQPQYGDQAKQNRICPTKSFVNLKSRFMLAVLCMAQGMKKKTKSNKMKA